MSETQKGYHILQKKNMLSNQYAQVMKLPLVETQSLIQELTHSISTLKDLLVSKEAELNETTLQLTTLRNQTASVHLRISVLKSNLQVRQEEKQVLAMEGQLNEYRSQLVSIDINAIQTDKVATEASVSKLTKEYV